MTFTIFQNEKPPFQAIKTRSSQSRKIDIFTKGLVNPWFWSKYGHFSNPFFQAILVRKMTFTIFQNAKTPFFAIKKKKFRMSKNLSYSKGVNPWFWCKYGHSSSLFFQAILVRKITFTIFQNEETPFQAIKNARSTKCRKIEDFPKGLTHRFGPKLAFFSNFFILNIGLENDFYDIIERKNAFLGYKNLKFKKSKN